MANVLINKAMTLTQGGVMFHLTGREGYPRAGEHYLNHNMSVVLASSDVSRRYKLVEPVRG